MPLLPRCSTCSVTLSRENAHEADHGAFESTKDPITSEEDEGKGTSNEGDLSTFVIPRLLEGADASFVALADRDMAHAWQPMSSCHPCNLHRTASCFDVSLVDPSIQSSYERPLYCASNVGSPDLTPSPTTLINSYPNSLASPASLPLYSLVNMRVVCILNPTLKATYRLGWDEVGDSPWDMVIW